MEDSYYLPDRNCPGSPATTEPRLLSDLDGGIRWDVGSEDRIRSDCESLSREHFEGEGDSAPRIVASDHTLDRSTQSWAGTESASSSMVMPPAAIATFSASPSPWNRVGRGGQRDASADGSERMDLSNVDPGGSWVGGSQSECSSALGVGEREGRRTGLSSVSSPSTAEAISVTIPATLQNPVIKWVMSAKHGVVGRMPCNLKASASVASLWSTSSSKGSKIQKRRPRKLKTKYGSSSSSPSPSPSRGVLSSPRISPLRMTVAGLLIVFVATVARHYDPACAAHLRAAPSDVVTPGSAPPWSHQVLSATRVARGIPAAAQCVMSSVATSFRDFVVGDVAAVVDGEASRSAIEAPSDAVAHLIECSDDNVMDLIQDLAVLPSSLNVSLSAHAALSLAASVQAVMDAETDVDEVADLSAESCNHALLSASLLDLAQSLNAASDSILHLSTKGFTISRQVHRRLHALLRAVSTAMMPAGASPARHASAKGSPSQQPQYHQASTITAERLQKLLDDAIEDMDAGLQELEARVHGCQVRAVEADTLWREAEKVAERERVRAERRGDRAAASSFSSSSRDRREREDDEAAKGRWTWSGIFAGGASKGDEHGKAQDVVVVAKRTERDLQLLRGVIGTLNGMSGSIVKLDLDVKRLRAHLQDFRGRIGAAAAEAERTWSGWREEGGLDALWGRLGRMEDALTGLRVREPVLPPN